jgi:DNA-binding GntR family transcriptional regulator
VKKVADEMDRTMELPASSPQGAGDGLASLSLLRDGKVPTRGATSDAVADALREAILDGTLKPGLWLREAEVARVLNVSRTPVRDAFRILASERLVEIKANQGVIVSAMTSDDVLELYVVREVLEGLAARLAARHAAAECREEFAALIPRMREAAEAVDSRELSRLNFEFHAILRRAAGNRYLEQSLTAVHQAARRFPDPTLGLPGRFEESITEHIALAEAISQGDGDAAEKLAVDHMRHLAELRIRMLLLN